MTEFTCSPVKTEDALRVLQSDGLFTFAVVVDGVEYHQQIPISDYDTQQKIEARMAEIGTQVAQEVAKNKPPSVPADILSMVTPDPQPVEVAPVDVPPVEATPVEAPQA